MNVNLLTPFVVSWSNHNQTKSVTNQKANGGINSKSKKGGSMADHSRGNNGKQAGGRKGHQ